MQTEVAFLGHIVGRAGLACDPEKLSAVRTWHTPDFPGVSEPLVALTHKEDVFAWTPERPDALRR